MTGNVGNILNIQQQKQLTILQRTSKAQDVIQLRLATGKKVSTALDNPQNFFTSVALDNRAEDLQKLLNHIDKSFLVIKETLHSIEAMQTILDTASSYLEEYREDFLNGNVGLVEVEDTSFFTVFDDVSAFSSYSGGQDGGNVGLIENPYGIILDDNAWKKLQVDYNITADTILEFDFRSTNIPEIAAIGFDNDDTYTNNNNFFFLYGTQFGGITYSDAIATYQYSDPGEWEHVQIPVGTYFTGNFSHLTFIDDDDGGGDDGDAQFRNLVIHEGDYVYGGTSLSVDPKYEQEYEAILQQLDFLAEDAIYGGINLLKEDDLTTFFNESRTSSLLTEGINATYAGLSLETEGFTTIEAVEEKIDQVAEARQILRRYASSLSVNLNIINDRQDFTKSLINILEEGRDDLTLSDQNKDGAELLALNTRELIQTSTLTANTFSIADFLI